jgi:N-acetylmuramoyl-L-alanine amidase
MRDINYIILHCTAGPSDQTIPVIKAYWKAPVPKGMGWKNPGYHYLIPTDGKYEKIHPIELIANGVAGHNSKSIHVSYIGGVEMLHSKDSKGKVINVVGKPKDTRTDEQIAAQILIIGKLRKLFPKAKIRGHRDFSVDKNKDGIIQPNEWMKSCPSFDVVSWCKSVGIDPL